MFVFHVLRHEKGLSKLKSCARKRFDSIKTKRTTITKSTAVSSTCMLLYLNGNLGRTFSNHSAESILILNYIISWKKLTLAVQTNKGNYRVELTIHF